MKYEPNSKEINHHDLTKKQANDLMSLMEGDKELRKQMAEVLRMELLGSRSTSYDATRDVGRVRR